MRAETIFALSSGVGRAGVAVVRVSGPAVRSVLSTLLRRLVEPRKATLATVRDPEDGSPIDQALVLFFPSPTSFTGEDIAEFHLHGSIAVVRRFLGLLGCRNDCRLAEAGEFTRRAFLSGKIDLLGVEGLSDMLAAETEMQRRMAMEGSLWLRQAARTWRERLIGLRAMAEAMLDFGDEGDVLDRLDSQTEQDIQQLAAEIGQATDRLKVGERIRQGYRVAILGPPNAGKSSLLNALADRDLAITSPIPGTTRDALEASIDLDGLAVVLVDTAGLRDAPGDEIEAEGMKRSQKAARDADLVLWASPIDSPAECSNASYHVVRTMADKAERRADGGLAVSSQTGQGLGELIAFIKAQALNGLEGVSLEKLVAHERQANSLLDARRCLIESARHGSVTLDIRAEELRAACHALDALIGTVDHEDVLAAIFSRFCIGK
ncbi:ThdF Predicted GTPase [Rhabdaerophilaceae bacterium]